MTTADTNRTNMIRTTNQYCDDNTTATAGIVAFAPVLATAKNKQTLIDQLDQLATGTSEGVTLDTKLLRETMCNIGFKCASGVFAFASATNNNKLKKAVDYSRSDLDKLRKDQVDDVCQTIHDETDDNIGDVGDYGLTPADVTDLQTAIDLYRASMQDPRQTIIEKKDANRQIKNLIREIVANEYKGQMDKMVNTLRYDNEIFYEKYYFAREIIDLGSTSTKIRGTVTDEAGSPLAGAILALLITGETAIAYQDKTNEGGEFNIAQITADNYDIEVTLAGYQSHTETDVRFGPGKELSRSIVLQPEIIS